MLLLNFNIFYIILHLCIFPKRNSKTYHQNSKSAETFQFGAKNGFQNEIDNFEYDFKHTMVFNALLCETPNGYRVDHLLLNCNRSTSSIGGSLFFFFF